MTRDQIKALIEESVSSTCGDDCCRCKHELDGLDEAADAIVNALQASVPVKINSVSLPAEQFERMLVEMENDRRRVLADPMTPEWIKDILRTNTVSHLRTEPASPLNQENDRG